MDLLLREAGGKECAMKSAKVDYYTEGEGADYFPKWQTLTKWSTAYKEREQTISKSGRLFLP